MHVVFSDLDGTVLDHYTYEWTAARPALARLRKAGVPCVFVTSKTRAETEHWRMKFDNEHPFVVENGGAAFIPSGYFPFSVPGAKLLDWYEVIEWGHSYRDLVAALRTASEITGCQVRGFSEMPVEEVAAACDLPLDQAFLAKAREYDEPFLVLRPGGEAPLLKAIEEQGLRCTRGGRFWHITGANNKAKAVKILASLYHRAYGPVKTIGLGDGPNDAAFLNEVAVPILVRSAHLEELRRKVPQGRVTSLPGPAGWNDALLAALSDGPR